MKKLLRYGMLVVILLGSVISASILITTSQKELNIDQPFQQATQKPINPNPDNIQILGVADIKKTNQPPTATTISKPTQFDTHSLYRLINSYRADNNLNKLSINPLLEDSAQRKLNDMIANEYFKHQDENNIESWYLFQAAGYQYTFAGENLSLGNNTPWQVFEAWQKSPKHDAQLLKSEYLDMGLAVNCTEYKINANIACIGVLHLGAR